MHHRPIILGTLTIVLALSPVGCQRVSPEEQISKHRQRAIAYMKNGEYPEAIVELRNVLQLEPNNGDAHYQMALAHIKLGHISNLREAYAELVHTVKLDKTNVDAQLKLGELYLLGNEPTKAREQADIVLASSPQNTDGLILRGRGLIQETRYQEGIVELRKAIERVPNAMQTYIDLARAQFALKDKAAAEATLNQALTVNPRSIEVMLALADFRDSTEKLDQAEQIYNRAIETAPDNDLVYLKLASHYQRHNKLAEAEVVLEKLATNKPQAEAPQIHLGDFFTFIGQPHKATSKYQRALEINSTSIVARDKLIGHYLDIAKLPEAETIISTILRKDSQDVAGRFFDARVKLIQSKPDDAITILQGVIKDMPQSADAHYFLGIAFMQKRQLAQARSALAEALKYDPRHGHAHTALAQVYLAEGSVDLALQQAQAASQLNPRNIQAAVLSGDAYLRKGDIVKSRQVFEGIAKALPTQATGPYRLGLVARAEKNHAKALTHFEEALSRQPSAIEPLTQIAVILAAQGNHAEARQRVAQQLALDPQNPHPYDLLGQLWADRKEYKQAEENYRKAIELNPTLLPVYMRLAQTLYLTGRLDDAMNEYTTVLTKDPSAVHAHMMLGLIHERRKEFDKAQHRYETILKLNPTFSPAANNLAWILTEHGGNLDLALSYARTAHEGSPNDPHVADTLGWVYYKKNVPLLAIDLLKEAVEKLPNEAEVHFHYGMALHKATNKIQAKQALRTALQLSADFSGAEEARRTLKQLL